MKNLIKARRITFLDVSILSSGLFLMLLGICLFAVYQFPIHLVFIFLGHFFGSIWCTIRSFYY